MMIHLGERGELLRQWQRRDSRVHALTEFIENRRMGSTQLAAYLLRT